MVEEGVASPEDSGARPERASATGLERRGDGPSPRSQRHAYAMTAWAPAHLLGSPRGDHAHRSRRLGAVPIGAARVVVRVTGSLRLAVRRLGRCPGLAGHLIRAVADWAAAQGMSTYLMVRNDNVRARTAYERAGFVDTGVPEGWPIDEPPERPMELRT